MGLAMFGTLDEKQSVDYVSHSNSMDAYERMRSDYHHLGISAFSHDDISVGVISEAGYSSPEDFHMDMSSLEGDGNDWVKMSEKHFEYHHQHQHQQPSRRAVSSSSYRQ